MESFYEKEQKHTFSYGGLGTDDGKEQHIPAGQVGRSLPPEPSVAWRRSQPWGCWQEDCVRAKGAGRAFAMSGWVESGGSVRGLLRWPESSTFL